MVKAVNYLLYLLRAGSFYMIHRFRYRELRFGAMIVKPLRINGARYISLRRHVSVQSGSWLFAARIGDADPELIIDSGARIGDRNHIAAVKRVYIGKNVLTASGVYISDNIHSYEDIDLPVMHQPVRFKGEVSIGEGAWLGENVCVIGARVGRNCVIGANAVVTRDIPDYSVAVGSPARVIKRYNHSTKNWEITEPLR